MAAWKWHAKPMILWHALMSNIQKTAWIHQTLYEPRRKRHYGNPTPQLQYLGWIMGIPEWGYHLNLPPNRGYQSPPRFSTVLSFRNPNLNLYLLASWEGGMKFQSIIYNPLKNNQASIPTASNNQYQAIIYNTKLSSRSCILVVATMPFYNILEIV